MFLCRRTSAFWNIYICQKKGEMKFQLWNVGAMLIAGLWSCTGNNTDKENNKVQETEQVRPTLPLFDADSAYSFVKWQCDIGPRIPGSKAHALAVQYFYQKLAAYTDTVMIQKAPVKTFDGNTFTMQNIIASFNPENKNRILLCAHYDTRPWADGEENDKYKPFMSADDGPSGVGVLLEVARQLQILKTSAGVDIVLFDMEDYGQEQDDTRYGQQQNTWCLGSQYWARNPHTTNYTARYGILLDMVGGRNAIFPLEGTSLQYAQSQQRIIWDAAASLGFDNFTNAQTNPTIDDHLYINTLAGIPTVDIVHYDVSKPDYPSWHHRQSDTMDNIDKTTLQRVGQLVIYMVTQSTNL